MPVSWIEHRGHRILLFDYRDQRTSEALIATLEAGSALMQPLAQPALLLNDFEGAAIGSDFMHRVKAVGRQNTRLFARSAVIGVSGLKTVFFNAYLRATGEKNTRAFDSREEALAFLVR